MNVSNYYKKLLIRAHDNVLQCAKDLLDSINSLFSLIPPDNIEYLEKTNYPQYETYKRTYRSRVNFFHQCLENYQKAFYQEKAISELSIIDSREESGNL